MNVPRRKLLSRHLWLGALALGGLVFAGRSAHAGSHTPPREGIVQPEHPTAEAFVARAFELQQRASAAGDQAYGALLVKDGRIVGEAPSRVILARDPTAHAEMEAIRDAARRLGTRDLSGAAMYSSAKPCPMCEAAAYWAGVSRLHYGRDGADGGAPRLCG